MPQDRRNGRSGRSPGDCTYDQYQPARRTLRPVWRLLRLDSPDRPRLMLILPPFPIISVPVGGYCLTNRRQYAHPEPCQKIEF